jgi:hypothetical protein
VQKVIQVLFSELEAGLPGLNYVVHLAAHSIPSVPGVLPENYVRAVLEPGTEIGRLYPVTTDVLLADVAACLRHRGDSGYGPDHSFLRSTRFSRLMDRLHESLAGLGAQATGVWGFAVGDGLPLYPVWWGFGYLIVTPTRAEIIVGASSD